MHFTFFVEFARVLPIGSPLGPLSISGDAARAGLKRLAAELDETQKRLAAAEHQCVEKEKALRYSAVVGVTRPPSQAFCPGPSGVETSTWGWRQ